MPHARFALAYLAPPAPCDIIQMNDLAVIERKPAPPDADEWKDVKEKRQLIEK